MKKNLRIVSAAAAALLAVAPVAATVVPAASTTVSAATNGATLKNGKYEVSGLNLSAKSTDTSDVAKQSLINQINGALTAQVLHNNVSAKVEAANVLLSADGKTVTFNMAVKDNDTQAPVSTWGAFDIKKTNKSWKKENGQYLLAQNGNVVTFTAPVSFGTATADKSSEHIVTNGSNISNGIFADDPNTAVNINAVAKYSEDGATVGFGSSINGQIVYTDAKGASHTALLHGDNNTTVIDYNTGKAATELKAGNRYVANFNKVTINLGNAEAGKQVKFVLPRNAWFKNSGTKYSNVKTVTVDSNGIADLGEVYAYFYAYNPSDLQEIHFFSEKTGNIVTSGNINLHAVNGKLNLYSFFHAMNQEYVASQLDNGKGSTYASVTDAEGKHIMLPVAVQNDLRDQLKKQNITVDDNGYFTAPASFTVNMNAKSIYNGATASLPVTVTVDNVTPTAANETTKNVTIMHIATIYDKNGKATHEPALRAYDTYSVVATPVSLKDEKGKDAGMFYKLAGKDQYIKVGNVDGTKRSLKKNSYVYKSTGKAYMKSKKHHRVLKAGSSVTTYGKSFMIAGHQMYRIGKNQYVKKANF